jgi:hypothetical protein
MVKRHDSTCLDLANSCWQLAENLAAAEYFLKAGGHKQRDAAETSSSVGHSQKQHWWHCSAVPAAECTSDHQIPYQSAEMVMKSI